MMTRPSHRCEIMFEMNCGRSRMPLVMVCPPPLPPPPLPRLPPDTPVPASVHPDSHSD